MTIIIFRWERKLSLNGFKMLGIGSTTSSIYTALGTTLARENEEELEKKLLVLVYNQTKSVILSSCEMKKRLGIYLVSELKKWS